MQKILFLLVFSCLASSLCASSDDQQPCYKPKLTKKMLDTLKTIEKEALHGKTVWTSFWQAVFNIARDKETSQIIGLIQKGADPRQLLFSKDDTPLVTAIRFYNPKITELCLQHVIDPNNQQNEPWTTPLHVLCHINSNYGRNYEDFLKKLALLRFFNTDLDHKDPQGRTPRDVLQKKNPSAITDFDAVMTATDIVRKSKKEQTDQSRSFFLRHHLPIAPVVALVNEFSDDAFWSPHCWLEIKKQTANGVINIANFGKCDTP